ncbi:MAG: hypothetical protein K2X35_10050 [Bryobacteraceae bacterium]|nr:hypothetical protein [Bryobacteraceae bacterium]
MNADFFAAILEGFEGTFDEVLARELPATLRASATALQRHIAHQREQIEQLACCTARPAASGPIQSGESI